MINRLLYGGKRRDRWWRYLALRDAFLSAQSAEQPEIELARVFGKLGYGHPVPSVARCWHSLVKLGSVRAPVLEPGSEHALMADVKALDPALLTMLGWLDFYHLAIGMGLYQPANAFRDLAIQRSLLAAQSDAPARQDLISGFYASVETGQYQRAGELVERLSTVGCTYQQVEQARWFLDLFSGQLAERSGGFGPPTSDDDRRFGHYIEGKELALVGPVPSETEQGPYIDQHDVVVKFSYRGGEKGREPKTQGRRLDVSYYNNTQAQTLASSNVDQVLGSIGWGVCINRKGRSRFPRQQDHLRHITSLQWLLPDTHFNAGPNAVIDLLRFNPGTIRIFNTDLMLSAGRYAGYRPAGAKPIQYTRSFIKTHDPVLQYKTMHRLWTLGYIVGDQRFEDVMNMGLEDYLAQLQKVHGANEQALL